MGRYFLAVIFQLHVTLEPKLILSHITSHITISVRIISSKSSDTTYDHIQCRTEALRNERLQVFA